MKKNWNNPTLKMLEVEKTYEDNDCLVTDSTGQTVTEATPIPACDLDITFNVKCLCCGWTYGKTCNTPGEALDAYRNNHGTGFFKLRCPNRGENGCKIS